MQLIMRFVGFAGLVLAALALPPQAAAQTNTFSLQADPPSIEIAPGHSGMVSVSSAVVTGDAESISFDASGLPANVTLSFDPPSVDAGSPTTLTISAASGAILGTTATITVRGTALSDTETTTVALRIASYVSQEEWSALAALYNSTGGSTWTKNTSWDVSGSGPNGTECSWYGIECDATPHIIEIALPTNNLIGPLPDLNALSGLATLELSGNGLTGPLMDSIQNLSALTVVSVESNQLSGSLNALSGLQNLHYFGGDENVFSGTLPQLSSMPNLMGFSVPDNLLTGPMPSLALSTNVIYLSVSGNYLTGAFPSLDGLPKLQYLYISGNRFTGLMPKPPNPTRFGSGVVSLCPNFFAAVANSQWNLLTHTNPWYAACDTDTIFAFGFGEPPTLQ